MPTAIQNSCTLVIRQSPKLGTRSPRESLFLTRAIFDETLELLPNLEGFHSPRPAANAATAARGRARGGGSPRKWGTPSEIARVRKKPFARRSGAQFGLSLQGGAQLLKYRVGATYVYSTLSWVYPKSDRRKGGCLDLILTGGY